MLIEINKRYIRKSPNGDESIFNVKSEEEVNYHQSYLDKGFVYTEVIPIVIPDATCVGCEG